MAQSNTNKNIEFVDKSGLPLGDEKLPTHSREQIIKNVFTYLMSDENEAQTLITSAVQYLPPEQINIENNQISLNTNSPEFQDFILLYATQKVMDMALDENLTEAYDLLTKFTGASKYRRSEGANLDEEDLKELEKYYAQAPELQLAQQICNIQLEINETMSGQSGKCFTSFQANRIQELFEDMMPYLNFEQRAAAYYNVSLIHRALLAEKDYYDPAENNSEKECLKKVLSYTVDYKRINYCLNRLGTSFKDQGAIRAAYRRALTEADSESDLCKINLALADCYVSDYHPKIGYRYTNNPEYEHEDEKLVRAEMHYHSALDHATDPEKLHILKRIAKLQLQQGKLPQWTDTQTTIAMEYMQGEERCHTLLNIAERNTNVRVPYMEQVVREASKSKEMTPLQKADMVNKASMALRPLYERDHNQEALNKLESICRKVNKGVAPASNPLDRYVKNSRKSKTLG